MCNMKEDVPVSKARIMPLWGGLCSRPRAGIMREQWGKTHENPRSKADEFLEREDKTQRLRDSAGKSPGAK